MNKVLKNMSIISGMSYTENGDSTYTTTSNKCLDFFSIAGACRDCEEIFVNHFVDAYFEDAAKALKILFYSRDIRNGGTGERSSFRAAFKYLCELYSDTAEKLIISGLIEKYGRYDDLFEAFDTPAEDVMLAYIKKVFYEDIKSENPSLLGKWMPSENASSPKTISMAKGFIKTFKMTPKEYRKHITNLRKKIKIIETNLTNRDYTFDYSTVPAGAMNKYINAFIKNDDERYQKYKEFVKAGITSIKTSTIFPYQIIRNYEKDPETAELKWSNYDRTEISGNTIVVRDGSASMGGLPEEIASSLSIMFSENLTGPFKNTFITFSEHPRLVNFGNRKTLGEKLEYLENFNEIANTDLRKVFELIIKSEKDANPKDYIKRIVIISDMEFDSGTEDVPTHEDAKRMFEDAGLPMPVVIYWNVNSRNGCIPTVDENNVVLVSGASPVTMRYIENSDKNNSIDIMEAAISKYSDVEDAFNRNIDINKFVSDSKLKRVKKKKRK